MELICDNCEKIFQRARTKHKKYKFCCPECHKLWMKSKTKINKCKFCGKETRNPAFCCKSCAASYNNKEFPKRGKESKSVKAGKITIKKSFCVICEVQIKYRRTYCDECNPQRVDWSQVTFANINSKRIYQKHSRIRNLARNAYLKLDKPKECVICGYDKHFHVCHIKPISSFTEDVPVSTINNLNNLIALCPNHHWELDNGTLTLGL
jgi:hypothetical protein